MSPKDVQAVDSPESSKEGVQAVSAVILGELIETAALEA